MYKQRIKLWLKASRCFVGGLLFLALYSTDGYAQVAGDLLQIRSIESVQQDRITSAFEETTNQEQDAIAAQDGICDLGYYFDSSANKGTGGCRPISPDYCTDNPEDSECGNLEELCKHVPSAPICQ